MMLPKLAGDERRFQQVLINLVKNALKFTEAGHIEVRLAYNEHRQFLVGQVVDTGVGIAQEELA